MKSLDCISKEVFSLLKRHELLKPLVRGELVADVIADIEISEDEYNQALARLWEQQKISNESEFHGWLKANQTDKDGIMEKLVAPIRLQKHCTDTYSSRAEMRFLERKNELDQVVYSLIRVKDPFQARELYLQIAGGEADFANIASKYSEGRERATRGVVGPVPLIQAHPKLRELLRSSQPGELREPLQVEDWHLVVRLESYQAAVLDATMELRMSQELFSEWVEEEVERKIKELSTTMCEVVPVGSADSSS